MAFPQYRIPVERLKEEWSQRFRMEESGINLPAAVSPISFPANSHPATIGELIERTRQINEAVAQSDQKLVMSEDGKFTPP